MTALATAREMIEAFGLFELGSVLFAAQLATAVGLIEAMRRLAARFIGS